MTPGGADARVNVLRLAYERAELCWVTACVRPRTMMTSAAEAFAKHQTKTLVIASTPVLPG